MKPLAFIITISLINLLTPCSLSYANGDIIGCYKKNGGQLRIVGNASECLPSEVSISWNQGGVPGPAGPAGPPGAPGGASNITIRQIEPIPNPCANGWCPNGFKWTFHILDSAVVEGSVIAINIVNPYLNDYGCEVATKSVGQFVIICIGDDYVRSDAILQYAVFNP